MDQYNNIAKYKDFRKRFPHFLYESFSITKKPEGLLLEYVFKVGEYTFRPHLIVMAENIHEEEASSPVVQSMAFHIGMVEMISYWKAFCCPKVTITPFKLTKDQQQWWKKLFIHGLGEFFYSNGITLNDHSPVDFSFSEMAKSLPLPETNPVPSNKLIIPVGGGKDSVVTVELLKATKSICHSLVINPRAATNRVIEIAGFKKPHQIEVLRSIDPLMYQLNEEGFLNGHTPFSALLAFVSLLAAQLHHSRHIALSNESSANEPSIPGTTINHQYSKSLEFETDFRNYVRNYIHTEINYFSFLRPLNEFQIAALFSTMPQYHQSFRSCNAGSKSDVWCCACSKCLFTYIILSPFLSEDKLGRIFGENLFKKQTLIPLLRQLCGLDDNKPFECVGTIEEVNTAMRIALHEYETKDKPLPVLLDYYKKAAGNTTPAFVKPSQLLEMIGNLDFLPDEYQDILIKRVQSMKPSQ